MLILIYTLLNIPKLNRKKTMSRIIRPKVRVIEGYLIVNASIPLLQRLMYFEQILSGLWAFFILCNPLKMIFSATNNAGK